MALIKIGRGEENDPLAPLWNKADQAADNGDMPGVVFVWKALADKGVWQFCVAIAELYETGAEGIAVDLAQSLIWYRKAVFEGDDPAAHAGLGRLYFNGVAIERDFAKSLEHFERALQGGRQEAGINLGTMYFSGVGVTADIGRAKEFLSIAADAGYPYASLVLGRIALNQRRLIRAASLFMKGLWKALEISRKNPADEMLYGFQDRKVPQNF